MLTDGVQATINVRGETNRRPGRKFTFNEHAFLENYLGRDYTAKIYLEDNGTVFMRQYAETLNEYQVIHISYKQFIDMVKSLEADAVNGMYRMETVSSSGSSGVQK